MDEINCSCVSHIAPRSSDPAAVTAQSIVASTVLRGHRLAVIGAKLIRELHVQVLSVFCPAFDCPGPRPLPHSTLTSALRDR